MNFGKTWFTGALPELWLFVLGALFIVRDVAAAARLDGSVRPARPRRRSGRGAFAGRRCRARGHGMTEAGSLLYLNGVTVSFDGFRALDSLSLVLAPGEMRAVIGPNGAGKTTMMDVITGKTRPDAGRVVFGEAPISRGSTSRPSPRSASGASSRSRRCSSRTRFGTICCWRSPATAGPASRCARARPRPSGADRGNPRRHPPHAGA